MTSVHWNLDPDLVTWVRAQSERLGRSTSQVVGRILRAAKLAESSLDGLTVAAFLEQESVDDASADEHAAPHGAVGVAELGWDVALHQRKVAAHVEDLVEDLDVDRTDFVARTAGGA